MNIYFIRHGDPDYTTDSLTALGCEQAEKLAESLKNLHVDELYQSSMGRAKQTCSYCAEKWNIEPVTLEWAKELCWGNKSGDAYATESPWSISSNWIKNDHKYPEGENWREQPELKNDRLTDDIDNRTKELDKFLAEHGYVREGQLYRVVEPNDKNIVIVCHGGIISDFLSHLLNIPYFHFIAHIGLHVTSVSKISLGGQTGDYCAAYLDFLNNTNHLNKL